MTQPAARVLVPARLASSDDRDPRVAGANRIFSDVVELVRLAGMDPVVVTDPDADLGGCAGLVLPGGGDPDPARYGGAMSAAVYDVNPEQDHLDFTLARRALDAQLPVYGICRGAQVLNILRGGTLHVDLAPSRVVHAGPDGFVDHGIAVAPRTLLAQSLGGRHEVRVRSAHHQGIKDLGEGLTATAHAPDGLVEAFEDRAAWVLGVQWHPEVEAAAGPVRDGQFRALAAEIRRRSAAGGDGP